MSVDSPEGIPGVDLSLSYADLSPEEAELMRIIDQVTIAREEIFSRAIVFKERPFPRYAKKMGEKGNLWVDAVEKYIDHLNSEMIDKAPFALASLLVAEDEARAEAFTALMPKAGVKPRPNTTELLEELMSPRDDRTVVDKGTAMEYLIDGFNRDNNKLERAVFGTRKGKIATHAPKVGKAILNTGATTFAVWAGVSLSRKK